MLDVRARAISDEMAAAVARALAAFTEERGLREDYRMHVRVAVAAATEAQARGLARVARTAAELEADARRMMQNARDSPPRWRGPG